jgi:dynamin 1-like protein
MDYINTSHPNFVGGSKVVELAKHEALPSKTSTSVLGRRVLPFASQIL